MAQHSEQADVVVVGGGLAGLLVAEGAARAGQRVVLLERSAAPGGRARTAQCGAYAFNFGPHALYLKGPLDHALRAAGVSTAGVAPSLGGAAALFADGRLDALPVGVAGAWRASWFGARDVVELLAAMRTIRGTRDERETTLHEQPATAWLDGLATREATRALLAALVQLATYGGDLAEMSADVAQLQLAGSVRHGVVYVHGGWQALVSGLLARAQRAGVRVLHSRAAAFELREPGPAHVSAHRVTDVDGRTFEAPHVVFACAPTVTDGLLAGADPVLKGFAVQARPVTMRCVDLGLRDGRDLRFTLGVDVPFYLSPQRGVCGVAPEGAVTVHAGLYLGAEDPGAPRVAAAADLDDALARAVPDLATRTLERRVLPRALVHNALPEWRRGGLRGRPACASSVPGVWFAGDWVGPRGHLSDAAAASALDVVAGIAAQREGTLRYAS